MTTLKTAKYVREAPTREARHEHITTMVPTLTSDENFGNLGFHMYWQPISEAYTMESKSHKHDFTQYLIFSGSNPKDLVDLGGEIEFTLSEDGKTMEKYVFTKATTVYIPAGLYHCPLVFKKVTKPILAMDIYFTDTYKRK